MIFLTVQDERVDMRFWVRGKTVPKATVVVAVYRQAGANAVEVSWTEGPGSPAPIYQARGYEPSGKIDDGEIHAVKQLR